MTALDALMARAIDMSLPEARAIARSRDASDDQLSQAMDILACGNWMDQDTAKGLRRYLAERKLAAAKPRPVYDEPPEGPGLGPWIVGTLALGVLIVIGVGLLL